LILKFFYRKILDMIYKVRNYKIRICINFVNEFVLYLKSLVRIYSFYAFKQYYCKIKLLVDITIKYYIDKFSYLYTFNRTK